MLRYSPLAPAVDYLRVMFNARLAEARSADREKGASVVEWVVITTIVVVIAITVGVLITNALNTKGQDIKACINDAGTTTTCTSGG